MTTIYTKVCGIPCMAELTWFATNERGHWIGRGCPYDVEMEFRILDSRGKPAPWLEKKLTENDKIRIEEEFIRAINQPPEYDGY